MLILEQIYTSNDNLVAVFTDYKSRSIIEFCEQRSINLFKGNPRQGKAKSFLKLFQCDVVLSVNYLFIIESDIINKSSKYSINLHGSKLPKYRGRTPHVWAIINGENETAVTAHIIDEKLDNGDIVEQIIVPIKMDETGADILIKFKEIYPTVVDSIMDKIKTNTIVQTPQDPSLATYFGKRTPADGMINWTWHKERIRNWIRAQARPYPGAFTFLGDLKIIIHKADISNLGFGQDQQNGEILLINDNNITVKTSNGTLLLSQIVTKLPPDLKPGKVLR